MINVTKLWCGGEFEGDGLRYARREGGAPVVVWNCTALCNLRCRHCYAEASSRRRRGELSGDEARRMIDDLAGFGVPVLLFSGGEPLLREDLFDLGAHARSLGMRTVISTNGTLIGEAEAERIRENGFSYVGVSIDGMGETNDRFRGVEGAFDAAKWGIRACRMAGLRTGLRFTVTRHNRDQLERVLDFGREEWVNRLCIYHLVYAGRGSDMENDDIGREEARALVGEIISKAAEYHASDSSCELLTVDNHADGVYVYLGLLKEDPARADSAMDLLERAGGNRSGEGIGCIGPEGNVYADQFLRSLPLGNVRERPFSEIWSDGGNEILAALRDRKSLLKGRCGRCRWKAVCNGNMRARALACYGDLMAEDPACYLTEEEISPLAEGRRAAMMPPEEGPGV